MPATIKDPVLNLFRQAREAILRVSPRAHDDAVLAVARSLHEGKKLDDGTIALIVTETDPVAMTIRGWLRGHS